MPGFQASRWANTARIGRDGTRDECIAAYRSWLRALLAQSPEAREELEKLRGLRLGCWCSPLACHGDVLVELLEPLSELAPAPTQQSLF